MGYHRLPSWRDYWSTSIDLKVPFVSDVMSRKRFNDILTFLHINDNSSRAKDCKDKLYKLRPFLTTFNNRNSELYNMTREVSVDESMIIFKGRSTLKQYNPMKPIKRGYKLWCLADQHGYISNLSIYQGKEEVIDEFHNFGLGERVVLNLTKPYWNKGIMVYFDNYFTSINLLEKLKTENTFACGTIRSTRKGIPPLAPDESLKRGMFDYKTNIMGITVYKWKDNRIVHLASNFHGTEVDTVKRTQKDGSKLQVPCPRIIKDYNKYMGGVDKADQLRALYCVNRKSHKWWHRLFWGILDITFVNSYIINNALQNKKISVLEFRRAVTQGLVILGKPKPKKSTPSPNTNKKRVCLQPRRGKQMYSTSNDIRLSNVGVHTVEFVGKRGRCEVCSVRKVESKPNCICSTCKVFLCLNEKKQCFNEYHSL